MGRFTLILWILFSFSLPGLADDSIETILSQLLESEGQNSSSLSKESQKKVLDFLLHLESEQSTEKDWQLFFKYTDVDLKLSVIPDLGISHIHEMVKWGGLALRLYRIDSGFSLLGDMKTKIQGAAEISAMGTSPTLMIDGFKKLLNSAQGITELIEVLSDAKRLTEGSALGEKIDLLEADYQPLSRFIQFAETFKLLNRLSDLKEEPSFQQFRELLIVEAYLDFVQISRQVAGLKQGMGGQVLANEFIAITAFAMSDWSPELMPELITKFKRQIPQTSTQENGPKQKELRRQELADCLKGLNSSLENIEEIRNKPEYSGKLVSVGILSLGLLQQEFHSVEEALRYLKVAKKTLEKMVPESSYLEKLLGGTGATITLLESIGSGSGKWFLKGLSYQQFALNWTTDMGSRVVSQVSQRWEQVEKSMSQSLGDSFAGARKGVGGMLSRARYWGRQSVSTSYRCSEIFSE